MTTSSAEGFDRFESEYRLAARRHRSIGYLKAIVAYAILTLFAVVTVGPLAYIISPTFREGFDLFAYGARWVPETLYTGNITFLFENTQYLRWALNTLIVATATTVISLFITSLAAYAFATMAFPGRRTLFVAILATMMVPWAALIAPLFIIVKTLGMLNTYEGLILPMVVTPLGIFMLKQFIETLPAGLYDAARLDGASEWAIYRRIVIPLVRPALVVLGILVFMFQWSNFLWPLVVTTESNMRTLTVGMASLRGPGVQVEWGIIAAGAVMTMLPAVIVFLLFQRWFMRASLAGAIKG